MGDNRHCRSDQLVSWSLGSGFGCASFLSLPLELGFEPREFLEFSVHELCIHSLCFSVVCPFPDSWLETSGLSRERKKRRVSFQPQRELLPRTNTARQRRSAPTVFLSQLSTFWLWRRRWRSSSLDIIGGTAEALLCSAILCFCAEQPTWLRPRRWSERSLEAF